MVLYRGSINESTLSLGGLLRGRGGMVGRTDCVAAIRRICGWHNNVRTVNLSGALGCTFTIVDRVRSNAFAFYADWGWTLVLSLTSLLL